MSNSLAPDQARHLVGPDMGPNCWQRLSADDTISKELTLQSPLPVNLPFPCSFSPA